MNSKAQTLDRKPYAAQTICASAYIRCTAWIGSAADGGPRVGGGSGPDAENQIHTYCEKGNEMDDREILLHTLRFHGHRCWASVAGARAGLAALRTLGVRRSGGTQ